MYSSMKYFNYFLTLVVISSLSLNCSQETKHSLDYSNFKVDTTFGDCSNACLKLNIEYALIQSTDSVLSEKINSEILYFSLCSLEGDSVYYYPQDFGEDLMKDLNEISSIYPSSSYEWFVERKAEIIFSSEEYLSIKFDEILFTGGAHPNRVISLRTYRLHNSEALIFDTLFSGSNLDSVARIGAKIFAKKYQLAESRWAEQSLWIEEESFQLPDEFAVVGDSVKFIFNTYEIAPYYRGSFEFAIPLESIQKFTDKL
ncbi:MAG: DUF3298 domain-containing protein [Bacteroidota bacterium]